MEGLRLSSATSILGITSPPIEIRSHHRTALVGAIGRTATGSSSKAESQVAGNQSFTFQMRGIRLWPRTEGEGNDGEKEEGVGRRKRRRRKGNWVMKILKIGSDLEGERAESDVEEEEEEEERIKEKIEDGDRCVGCCDGDESCSVDYDGDDEVVEIDRKVFSKLLIRVPLEKAESYAQLSHLGSLAYSIKEIEPGLLLKDRGLRYVTSSLEKRLTSSKDDAETTLTSEEEKSTGEAKSSSVQKKPGISASSVYQIVASAASYVQSQTSNVLPFGSRNNSASSERETELGVNSEIASPEEASFVVTTNSVTAVVAAKEEVKQAVADDLNTSRSSPCEWFTCDDDTSATRYFVIQGSETLASWQANLLFEPVQFEGFDILVHRGIYEAAKGIYEQMLPEIRAHLKSHGNSATLRFTGHSLGGSLSVLVNLMLLVRQEAPASALLPVITFGAPTIMCGGNYLLQKLGLPLNHIQAVTMHRDIVPRAFSCNYPDHVARILKTINKNFRSHPCLTHKKLLYEPMGEILILQPDEKFSPHHHLLPSGSGLYVLVHSLPKLRESRKFFRRAKSVFFNSPHPLEILSDRSAYGSEGTVTRDHDMSSYLKCINDVIEVLTEVSESRRKVKNDDIIVGWKSGYSRLSQINFSGVYQVGMEQFQKLVVSRHVQMFLVFFLPMQFLLLKALAAINFS